MKIKPVKNYQNPEIPTKKQAPQDFTKKFIPKRWLKNAIVACALCSFLSVGCKDTKIEPTPEPEKPEIPVQTSVAEAPTDAKQQIKFYNVAPIFSYSVTRDNRALLSPTAITTHVSITEEDARRIIIEESKKYGLNFTTEGEMPTFSGVDFLRDESSEIIPKKDEQKTDEAEKPKIFVFDGVDNDKRIVFEVITVQDLETKPGYFNLKSSISEAAQGLRKEFLTKKGDYTVGIFYDSDPVQNPFYPSANPPIIKYNETAVLLLRAQVQEFILWLAQNNLIELGKK